MKETTNRDVVTEVRGQIGFITLNRPKALNALTLQMVRDLMACLLAWRDDDAVKWVNVATQTIGFYPPERMADYRDRLGSGGAQRVCRLGEAGPSTVGNPWDGMYPLHRFVNWMVNEYGVAG